MANYPTALAEHVTLLIPDNGLGERADAALQSLHEKGFVAGVGLTALHMPEVFDIAQQDSVVETCPKDQKTRFAPDVVASWIGKGSNGFELGRGFAAIYDVRGNDGSPLSIPDVTNLTDADIDPVAYGWSGWEKNKHLPGKDVTTAFRSGEQGAALARARRSEGERFGLGSPITELVLATGVRIYNAPADRISLETWLSNNRAWGLYERTGFQHVPEADVFEEEGRPTLHEVGDVINGHVVFERDSEKLVQDTRRNYFLADHPLLEL